MTSYFRAALLCALGLWATHWLSSQFTVSGPSVDGALYANIADNLLSGHGFVDTLRNREILPSIGHPALIALHKGVVADVSARDFTRLQLLASFVLVF